MSFLKCQQAKVTSSSIYSTNLPWHHASLWQRFARNRRQAHKNTLCLNPCSLGNSLNCWSLISESPSKGNNYFIFQFAFSKHFIVLKPLLKSPLNCPCSCEISPSISCPFSLPNNQYHQKTSCLSPRSLSASKTNTILCMSLHQILSHTCSQCAAYANFIYPFHCSLNSKKTVSMCFLVLPNSNYVNILRTMFSTISTISENLPSLTNQNWPGFSLSVDTVQTSGNFQHSPFGFTFKQQLWPAFLSFDMSLCFPSLSNCPC